MSGNGSTAPRQEGETRIGPDGRSYKLMQLGSFWFEVSWRLENARLLRDRRSIDVVNAVRVLNDPGVVILPEEDSGNKAPYRAIGLTPSVRLLTVALDMLYLDEDEGLGGVGMSTYTPPRIPAAPKGRYASHAT